MKANNHRGACRGAGRSPKRGWTAALCSSGFSEGGGQSFAYPRTSYV